MKLIIVLAAIVGLAYGLPAVPAPPSCCLLEALQYITGQLPFDEVEKVFKKYENGADVQKIVAYLNSAGFQGLVNDILSETEIQLLIGYMGMHGVSLETIMGFVGRLFDLFGITWRPVRSSARDGSLRNLLDEVKLLFDVDEMTQIVRGLKAANKEFAELMDLISANEGVIERIRNHPEVQHIAQELRGMGVDTDEIVFLFRLLFGWV